jgi:hypothetical protein
MVESRSENVFKKIQWNISESVKGNDRISYTNEPLHCSKPIHLQKSVQKTSQALQIKAT